MTSLHVQKLCRCMILIGCVAVAACSNSTQKGDKPIALEGKGNGDSTPTSATASGGAALPVEFPQVGTNAATTEYVLAPSREFLDKSLEKGANSSTFIFYAANLVAPGESESTIKNLPGKTFSLPNSLIIPIGPGAEAKKGDILLTWWQSGSGMQRAIVVDDADPKQPSVRYLDLDLDNPSKVKGVPLGESEEKLKLNSFKKINAEWEPGTTVAVKDAGSYSEKRVVRVEGDRVMTLGFAGRLSSHPKADCKALPLVPDVKAGDKVWFPHIGKFREGTVTKVDARNGRVFVSYEVAGTAKEKGVQFGAISKDAL